MRQCKLLLATLLLLFIPRVSHLAQLPVEGGLLIDWHPSGTMIAYTIHGSNQVVIVDISNNVVLNTYTTSDVLFDPPQWSPDGQLLAITDSPTTIAIWSNVWDATLASVEYHLDVINELGYSNIPGISNYVWHPSGTQIALSYGTSIATWNLLSNQYYSLPINQHISQIADLKWFDEDRVLLGDTSPRVAIVNALTGEIETSLYLSDAVTLEAVSAVSPSPDRSRVAFGSTLGLLEIWDPSQGTFYDGFGLLSYESERSTCGSETPIASVEWSPTGEYITIADQDGLIRVWEAETFEIVQEYTGLARGSFAWSPDGMQLAFSTATDGLVIMDGSLITPVYEFPSADTDQTLTDTDDNAGESVTCQQRW